MSKTSERHTRNPMTFPFIIMVMVLLSFSSSFYTSRELPRTQDGWEFINDAKQSAAPTFTVPLSAKPAIISPENQDGIKDSVDLSFRPSQNGFYNLSIEEDIRTVDIRANTNALAGTSSKLLMLGVLNTQQKFEVFARFSTNLGKTWTSPVLTNLTDYSNTTHAGSYCANLDMVYNASDGSYILGALKNDTYYTHTVSFFKSFDGINWTFLNKTIPFNSLYYTNFDMVLSTNNSEVDAIITYPDSYYSYSFVSFVKLQNNGKLLKYKELHNSTNDIFNPTIAVSHVPGCITGTWSEEWYSGEYRYWLTNSFDYGSTWSTPVPLNASRGFVNDASPVYFNHNCRSMQLGYEPGGTLDVTFVMNITSIYMARSLDNGLHWTNMTVFRSYSGIQAYIYSLHVVDLGDGNKTIVFIGALDGNQMMGKFTDYGTSYFVLLKTVFSVRNAIANASSGVKFIWNGKSNAGTYARDGPYLARAWIKNNISETNPVPSEVRIMIVNSPTNASITLSNPCFSPASSASIGVKDSTEITVHSSKNAIFDVFCTSSFSMQPESKVTSAETGDFRGDVAMDKNSRIWSVFTGYSEHNRDIYLCKSDDYGLTFSAPIPLAVSAYPKDCPSIAIFGDSIYVVYFQVQPRPMDPWSAYADLYMVKSKDLGITWSSPEQITSADVSSAELIITPDVLVTPNGTLFVAYNQFRYYSLNRINVIKSIDGGATFSAPAVIRDLGGSELIMSTVSLAFDPSRYELIAASENYSVTGSIAHMNLLVYNSSTWGSTWGFRGMASGIVDDVAISGTWAPSRGVTIDVLSNGTWRSSAIGQTTEIRIATIQSNDGGLSWITVENYTLDSQIMTDYEYPNCHADMRSGSSPFGDVFYTYTKAPAINPIRNVYLKIFTSTRQHFSGQIVAGGNTTVMWNGKDLWGINCEERNYTITAVVVDNAGNVATVSEQCEIDNTPPAIIPDIPDIRSMLPTTSQIVAVRNNSTIDYTVTLYYRFSETGADTPVPAAYNGTAFVQTIPQSTTNVVLFSFVATDRAGNSATLGPWFYFRPVPIVIVTSSEGKADRPLDGRIKIDVQGLPKSQLQTVFFNYQFNNMNMTDPKQIQLEYDHNTADYVGYLNGSPQYSSLTFQVFIIRLGFNESESEPSGVQSSITQEAIPLLPELTLVYPWNLVIALASATFGLILGLMQAHSKRTTKKKIQARFVNMLDTSVPTASGLEKLPARTGIDKESRKSLLARGQLMYFVMTLGTLLIIAGGSLAAVVLKNGGTGMILSAIGILLSSLALMERVNIDASDAIYLERKRTSFFAFIHVLLIIAVLFVFMISAPLIEWFNYYVIKQSYTIGSIMIPRLYISLVTPVVTSIALIWISSYSELKNATRRIKKMQSAKTDFKVIWRQKEEIVSKLASNVSFKLFIFLMTIAFAVISTTQLAYYAEQGMILLVPFIITWLVVFLVNSVTLPGKDMIKDALDKWIIERSKKCPKCKEINLLNSVHCTACGQIFAGETMIVENTIECNKCNEKSPEKSKFCRGCGATLVIE
jgi:hypothetical protein